LSRAVHSLWIGKQLSPLEIACYRSWAQQGYRHHLWVYDPPEGIPGSSRVCDASQILPAERIFRYRSHYGKGSVSGFSNFFRYKLLWEQGGIWADSDVYCLRPLPGSPYLLVREADQVASCLLRAPAGSELMRACWHFCNHSDTASLRWAQTGPQLLTRKIRHLKLQRYLYEESAFLPVLWTEVHKLMRTPELDLQDCYTVHFWNQQLAEEGFDKEAHWPGSTYQRLIGNDEAH